MGRIRREGIGQEDIVKTKSESRDMGGLWRFGGVHILCLDLA